MRSSDSILGVADLLQLLSSTLAGRFGDVTVEGEIAGFTRATSGHCYFSLKDADGAPAMMRMALFRRSAAALRFAPQDGQRVKVRGRVAVYEPRGELQFVAEMMEPAGAGALYEQFLRLKAQLEREGLFDADRKRALPAFPKRLAVITSLGAAALHDVCTALARRAPQVELIVVPSLVQGAEAPAQLIRALQRANGRDDVDAILLVRGGGSMEDLWAFNDPQLVREVAASRLPLVCGVGHETDITLCDLAADLRAPTPTAAAELAAPAQAELLRQLLRAEQLLHDRFMRRLDAQGQRLDRLALRLARPAQGLARQQQRCRQLRERLQHALAMRLQTEAHRLQRLQPRFPQLAQSRLQRDGQRLDRLGAQLQAMAPQRVLARGFAWLDDGKGQALTHAAQLKPGQRVRAVLQDGRAELDVHAVQQDLAAES
jgi:exodeoxyribonuclease VII large subunit